MCKKPKSISNASELQCTVQEGRAAVEKSSNVHTRVVSAITVFTGSKVR